MAYKKTMKVTSKLVNTRKKVTKKRKLTKKRKRVSKPKSRKSNKLIRKVRSSSYKNKKKRRSFKKHKGGSDPEPPFNSDIAAIPLLIDDDGSLTESQVDNLEFELADHSWASTTPDQSMVSSFDEGNTTREDYSDDEEEEDDPLNIAFHEDDN